MAKLTVFSLSLLVLFYFTATSATDVCSKNCSNDESRVRCAEITQNGQKSYRFINQCQIEKLCQCNGASTSARQADASDCYKDPTYRNYCTDILKLAVLLLPSTQQGCIGQNGYYSQGSVLGLALGLGGFCAQEGQIGNPDQC